MKPLFEIEDGVLVRYNGDEEFVEIPPLDGDAFVTVIGSGAFSNCERLRGVTIPLTVRRIDKYAFAGCTALERIELPRSVRTIGDHAFFGCRRLSGVVLGDRLTAIGREAFMGCESLAGLRVPLSVEEIGEMAIGYIHARSVTKYDGFVIEGMKYSAAADYAFLNKITFRERA